MTRLIAFLRRALTGVEVRPVMDPNDWTNEALDAELLIQTDVRLQELMRQMDAQEATAHPGQKGDA
jgi:hypothetical protein